MTKLSFTLALTLCAAGLAAGADEKAPPPTIADRTAGMTRMEGFVDLYWDEAAGHLFLEIDRLGEEFLYQVSLASGLGSNPIGLDRGQLGGTHLLRADRVGPRVLLIERNYGFRALSDNPDEVRAVEEAFTPSVYWGFEVAAETDGRLLVDATDFFLRDAHGAARRIEEAGQGTFQLEPGRSVIHLPHTRSFPKNTEVETLLTFTGSKPGPLVRSVAANAEAITVRQHHSFVELPDAGYTPRAVDPRIGALPLTFSDYATPLDRPLQVQWAIRHRLKKKDPAAERSEPVEPLVYYLDRGVPEPIRSALLEGASWWNEAFEAAGFIDAFRVEMLPEGADPMDLRYNVIHWTHRSTRGWSYGSSVVDPRTGEILKGNVNLGSLRLRQDVLIGEGLFPPGPSAPAACGLSAAPGFGYLAEASGSDPVEMALARVRQLSAHEVGHTLGFPHNFIASTYGDRASVMDYPAPRVRITRDGELDLSDAYGKGIGVYDKLAVRWLYGDFPPGTDEDAALEAIVEEGLQGGLRFVDHVDNALVGAGHAYASVWDNGSDLVEELAHTLNVRRIGLERFDETALRPGELLAELERVLVPLYLHHRYQLAAALQSLGGADYTYATRGDGQVPLQIVPGDRQRRALDLALETLSVDFLALPERILALLPPRPPGAPAIEGFPRQTGLFFDPLTVATVAADFSVGSLLHPDRLARLQLFGSRSDGPDVAEVADRLLHATWDAPFPGDAYRTAVLRGVQRVALDRLLEQATTHPVAEVRAVLTERLLSLADRLEQLPQPSAFEHLAAADIRRWERREAPAVGPPPTPDVPPGSPIGAGSAQGW
ncbi:MAG: zinc-dependent metalloprotease [Acidobacteria bacterium]|nr:zinc-dependent metalloprotease [Acidobacteriota bacterium]